MTDGSRRSETAVRQGQQSRRPEAAEVRLNRYLAQCGVAARRKADALIAAGRVTVNGELPPAGGRLVRPGSDVVRLDGRVLREGRDHRYYVANKPPGYLSAVSDRSHRPLVIELLGQNGRGLHPVGRLDLDSRGLILLTDDGELSFRLQHPRHHVEKEYEVSVRGTPDEAALRRLREGVVLEEGATGPAEVEILDAGAVSRLRVVIRQGWKRQLRRALAAVGYPVLDLRRTRVGPVQLGRLKEGGYRALNDDEVAALQAATGLVALPGHGAAAG